MKYMDKTLSPAERAVDLLERMTLEEKIEQLSGYFLKGEAGLAAEKQVHECRGEIEITLVTDTAQELKDMICLLYTSLEPNRKSIN